jgi:hypothetical protein
MQRHPANAERVVNVLIRPCPKAVNGYTEAKDAKLCHRRIAVAQSFSLSTQRHGQNFRRSRRAHTIFHFLFSIFHPQCTRFRKANIPEADRDTFERFGELVIVSLLTSGLAPVAKELQAFYGVEEKQRNVKAWLTERGDSHERREQRLEFVEWAILVFVGVSVVVDFLLLWHQPCAR